MISYKLKNIIRVSIMKYGVLSKGKAFELFVRRLLLNVGFSEVKSDGAFVFDGAAGQMIQGLGEAHNADVLLQPPVQTPFYTPSRLLVECKDYGLKVGLNVLRSALGLREDINHFNIVDFEILKDRRANRRNTPIEFYNRYFYQVAVASMSGFTMQAQEFALTHRISLIDFGNTPFLQNFIAAVSATKTRGYPFDDPTEELDSIGRRTALAITPTGQIIFLYCQDKEVDFDNYYTLHWGSPDSLWELRTGNKSYLFKLPDKIREVWLSNIGDDDIKENAVNCKAKYLSNMVVYYIKYGAPTIKMISIDKGFLQEARDSLKRR